MALSSAPLIHILSGMYLHMYVFSLLVRKVLYFRGEVEKVKDGMEPRELARRYDRLGDLCCALKAYPAAAKFYGKQVTSVGNFALNNWYG